MVDWTKNHKAILLPNILPPHITIDTLILNANQLEFCFEFEFQINQLYIDTTKNLTDLENVISFALFQLKKDLKFPIRLPYCLKEPLQFGIDILDCGGIKFT